MDSGVTVISLMWGNAWERYGETFASTFAQHWPDDVRLLVVSDRDLPLPRGAVIPMSSLPGHSDFLARHKDERKARGLDRPAGEKTDANGYSWKHDAMKWAAQGMTPHRVVADLPDGEIVAWFDADCVTHHDVPKGWIEEMLGGADIIYLGRPPKHSEIGFWAAKLSPVIRGFLKAYADLYRSDTVFALREWHSAFAFDYALEGIRTSAQVKSLTPGGRGHVWFQSPLCQYTDHLKGDRKSAGRSQERTR